VWVAIDPATKLLLAIDVGERTLATAQRFVHHVTQVLAPDCAQLFRTDGFRAYRTSGTSSATRWRPWTPAMAAGLTDHVRTLQEVLLYRVPPWPQPQVQ